MCPATLIIFYVHGEGETHRGAPHYGTGGAAPREGTLRSAGTKSSKLTRKENRGTSLGGPRQVPRPLPALRFLRGKYNWQVKFSSQNDTCSGLPGQHRVWNWAKFYPTFLRNEEGSWFLRALWMWPLWLFFSPLEKSIKWGYGCILNVKFLRAPPNKHTNNLTPPAIQPSFPPQRLPFHPGCDPQGERKKALS